MKRPSVGASLKPLKSFQRRTVEHAFHRLFTADDSTGRFLVADEVGLGKTLVARGIIARAIDHLWNEVERIDIVYICSNGSIARANLPKLQVGGAEERSFALATRLTMLATELAHGDGQSGLAGSKLNFVSFTPGTSFNMGRSTGQGREREVLFQLLDPLMGPRTALMNLLQGGIVNRDRFRSRLIDNPRPIDDEIRQRFDAAFHELPDLHNRLRELLDTTFRRYHAWPREARYRRDDVIGELRRVLAGACVHALEPDLVILDEFQRFKSLLGTQGAERDAAADLAQELFQAKAQYGKRVRTLLLSATPYKLYTADAEIEHEEHYKDFLATTKFLLGDDEARVEELKHQLSRFGAALLRAAAGDTEQVDRIEQAKRAVEDRLGERKRSKPERDSSVEMSFPTGRAGPAHGRNLGEFPSRRSLAGIGVPTLCCARLGVGFCGPHPGGSIATGRQAASLQRGRAKPSARWRDTIGVDSGAVSRKAAEADRIMDLASWNARLAQHFSQLREVRHATWDEKPIFALEHGLEAEERKAVAAAVRAHIAHAAPSMDHALAWLVYAAEIGYGFSGDEYWQTFEEQTPGWTRRGDRYWVRRCYRMFEREYGGARPSGAWAEHFSIICWPITHAILPRDLQYQLARILYNLRHSFAAELLESPQKLGEFIAARSWNGNSRFQNFAQETRLVGQIAAALLLEGQHGTSSLIQAAALQRIGADLERKRQAREWIRGARRSVQDRAQIRSLWPGRPVPPTHVSSLDEARSEIATLGIEPRLVLRPRDASGYSWDVSLEIPDLSHLLVRFPKTRDILTGSRCTVAGTSGRPLARGRCLHGTLRVLLARWPSADEVLLQFEQSNPQLEYLLRTECLLRPGPSWLFRIASDGLAYELRSLCVRPGEQYILVSADGPVQTTEHLRPVQLQCEGVHGALIALPTALTSQWEAELERLRLGRARGIAVWPAGLGAVSWDGEGHGEWLASERPCLAICADHELRALIVSVGQDRFESNEIAAGAITFVELPELHVGLHTVRFHTCSGPKGTRQSTDDLDVVMRIREPRPWSPSVNSHGPLRVQVDPPAPTLEELWEGRVEVSVRGPAGRHVNCGVSLRDTESGAATVTKRLPPVALPVTPDTWKRHFGRHFQKSREAPLAYETAQVCEIEFTGEELGAFSVRCEREFTPLRWAVRRDGQRYKVRLLDDSGNTTPPLVVRMTFEKPMVEEVEEAVEHAHAYEVPTGGGLYLGRQGAFSAAVIMPPTVRGFADLRCAPHIDTRERSADAVLRAVAVARIWGGARLPGELFSATRQRDVLQALAAHILRLIGGDTWAAAELSFSRRPNGFADLKRAVSKHRQEAGIGAALASDYAALSTATSKERVQRVASLATSFHLLPSPPRPAIARHGNVILRGRPARERDPKWLAELALRLASNPAVVEEWAGEGLRAGTSRLVEVPTLARAARFLVITTDQHLQSPVAPGELYASWGWA